MSFLHRYFSQASKPTTRFSHKWNIWRKCETLQYNARTLNSFLKWRKSVLFNKSLFTFLNVALLFVHCSYDFSKELFLIVHRSLSKSTSLLMTRTLVRGLNTTLPKMAGQIPTLLVNFSIILLHFHPFQWRYCRLYWW